MITPSVVDPKLHLIHSCRGKETLRYISFKASTYNVEIKKTFEMAYIGITNREFAEVLLRRGLAGSGHVL